MTRGRFLPLLVLRTPNPFGFPAGQITYFSKNQEKKIRKKTHKTSEKKSKKNLERMRKKIKKLRENQKIRKENIKNQNEIKRLEK